MTDETKQAVRDAKRRQSDARARVEESMRDLGVVPRRFAFAADEADAAVDTAIRADERENIAARYQDYVRRVYGIQAGTDMLRFFQECDKVDRDARAKGDDHG